MSKRNPNRCRVIYRPAAKPKPPEASDDSGGKYKVIPWEINGEQVLIVVKKEGQEE